MGEASGSKAMRGDALAALALAALLAAMWSRQAWPMLSQLHLPDTDDVVRLQQIRDWLGGQAFSDLRQHRLGAAPGLAMHWSRLPDLVPGGLIWVFTPVIGRHAAELLAVIAWPTAVFAAALWLIAGITRALGQAANARTALIIAAIGYPATTLFLPGRIDHHGLQMVLMLIIVRALLGRARLATGLVAGAATVASIVIGMETAPFLLVGGGVFWVRWVQREVCSGAALGGFGAAALAALLVARAAFAPGAFGFPGCDGFTARVFLACLLSAGAGFALALASGRLPLARHRLIASAALGAVMATVLWPTLSACASPYAGVDPLVARLWLGHVGEAQPLFAAPFVDAFGYAGLLVLGLVTSAIHAARNPHGNWRLVLAFQLGALALTCVQLRGAYLGAMLAAPALATMVAAARKRGAIALAGAWLGSAGMLYPIAAQALSTAPTAARAPDKLPCTDRAVIARLNALPPGTLMAPMDAGAYALGGTRHRIIAAPYHRNNAGNAAMYRFFLGRPEQARALVAAWRADYVLLCADSFSENPPADRPRADSLAGQLWAGRTPGWLRAIRPHAHGVALFAVKRDLSAPPVAP